MVKNLVKLKPGQGGLIGIFLLALGVRLIFIFVVSEPDNAGVGVFEDTYHRWQIAYLTREIGWPQARRLWDLKGFEYLWGVVHPMLLNVGFSLFGRVDIWLARGLTALAGSGVAALIYGWGRRFFNLWVGLAGGLWVAVFPWLVWVDVSGSIEPLSFFWLLAGVWFWPKRPLITGLLLAVAAMTRIEAGLLGVGFLLGLGWLKPSLDKWVVAGGGYVLLMLVYMKYLAVKTGSLIYPWREYFLGVTEGKWGRGRGFEFSFDWVLGLMVLGVVGGLVWLGKKRPKFGSVLLMGFLGIGLSSWFLMGFGDYLDRLWGHRFIYFPVMFGGFLLAMVGFGYLAKILADKGKKVGYGLLGLWLMGLIWSQALWRPLRLGLEQTIPEWQAMKQVGEKFSQVYDGEGKVLIPANGGELTYALVKYGGLEGKNIVGQWFDVFYYAEDQVTEEQVGEWLKEEQIAWLMPGKEEYRRLVEDQADWFGIGQDLNGYELYKVELADD